MRQWYDNQIYLPSRELEELYHQENYDQIHIQLWELSVNLLWAYKIIAGKVKVFQVGVVEEIKDHLVRQDDVMPEDLTKI